MQTTKNESRIKFCKDCKFHSAYYGKCGKVIGEINRPVRKDFLCADCYEDNRNNDYKHFQPRKSLLRHIWESKGFIKTGGE